ncbi:hypothetical protein IAR50_006795 [Cryptococcus sp. DSM 104548]
MSNAQFYGGGQPQMQQYPPPGGDYYAKAPPPCTINTSPSRWSTTKDLLPSNRIGATVGVGLLAPRLVVVSALAVAAVWSAVLAPSAVRP